MVVAYLLSGFLLLGAEAGQADGFPADTSSKATAAEITRVVRTETGEASYYARWFHLRRAASGRIYNQNELVAAHRTLPFGTALRVTNLRNRRSVIVHVIDRGPFAQRHRRIIDLSLRAAERLGFIPHGLAPVKVEVIEFAPAVPPTAGVSVVPRLAARFEAIGKLLHAQSPAP